MLKVVIRAESRVSADKFLDQYGRTIGPRSYRFIQETKEWEVKQDIIVE